MASRKCARCGGRFSGDSGFVTCLLCRVPVIDDGGGCHYWDGAAPDPRVTHAETHVQDRLAERDDPKKKGRK